MRPGSGGEARVAAEAELRHLHLGPYGAGGGEVGDGHLNRINK